MLEEFQTNNYSADDYTALNDNLLYLDYIDHNYDFKVILIDPAIGYRYQGNFVGLLKELGVDQQLYLYTMYINRINNPADYDGKQTSIRLAIKPPIPSR